MASVTSRDFMLPSIPELYNDNFLDILIPPTQLESNQQKAAEAQTPTNPMMDALKSTTRQTRTTNLAPAYSTTGSSTLDAFTGLSRYSFASSMESLLPAAWAEDQEATLRIIWNLRSISDGKGEREAFYRAFGWLYVHHPRTAIANLGMLVEPVCEGGSGRGKGKKGKGKGKGKKGSASTAHGYWKDLLNILALAAVDELSGLSAPSEFLHAPRSRFTYPQRKGKDKSGIPASTRIAAAKAADNAASAAASVRRIVKQTVQHQQLVSKLSSDPKFRALFVAVARLFSAQLIKDIKVLDEIHRLGPDHDKRIALLKTISLAGKWAPTPNGAHDRVTNIASAISQLLYASQALICYPSVLSDPELPARERAGILRSFYQRWVLTELRRACACPEPLMSANRWSEIAYHRVPSLCMQNNAPHFVRHDPAGFEAYLTKVEGGTSSMTGKTLMPHELVGQAVKLGDGNGSDTLDGSGRRRKESEEMKGVRMRVAEAKTRVVEAQWKTLVESLRESGSIENSIAVCDVSGSMGSLYGDVKHPEPILPAISLSLLLASLASPPFSGGFITFSSEPKFLTVDTTQPLHAQVARLSQAHWSMTTDFRSVFVDLLLPLALKHKVRQEDMVKRVFVFSDMQFDACQPGNSQMHRTAPAHQAQQQWETNYDVIERTFKEAGYEVPEIVFWDLSRAGAPGAPQRTVETECDRKGVAMLNGFSGAMLKVFMGDKEEKEEMKEWEMVGEEKDEDKFSPVNVMKKALGQRSYQGLVVID